MRYLGNKESMLDEIRAVLQENGLLAQRHIFFDALCGSGSVADALKQNYDIIINDNLKWATIYSHGRICAAKCTFDRLGFDPFDFLNKSSTIAQGFIYDNYAPTNSNRMYFTPENAGRIDYFRKQIEQWNSDGKLTEDEYVFLLACLIESVSKVSNTAGVYGAFLKKWDPRALKPISFEKLESHPFAPLSLKVYNDKIENIISSVDCDILYLDPPYTQNQYGTQYHLLETLILDDDPMISPVTGSRKTSSMRSDWSQRYKSNIVFDKVLSCTKARYVILSYNNDGFMSKEFIESSMKRYGKPETFTCKQVSYKKYRNWKSRNSKEHFEYLFFVELKDKSEIKYESPLNYIGNKAKIIKDIQQYSPATYSSFIDAFAGGFNVGINMPCEKIICNDINHFVVDLISSMSTTSTYDYIMRVKKYIQRFGLEKGNEAAYNSARAHYNSLLPDQRDPKMLFAIIMYGFQQQIRFNGHHEFNNPVGIRWFNDKVLEKLISFSRRIKELNVSFFKMDYFELASVLEKDAFIYFDPPYTLTVGSYNDGKRGFKGWSDQQEAMLFEFADDLNSKGIHFMMSYVAEHKGAVNENLLAWIQRKQYRVIQLGDIIGISGSRRKEVLILNYDPL